MQICHARAYTARQHSRNRRKQNDSDILYTIPLELYHNGEQLHHGAPALALKTNDKTPPIDSPRSSTFNHFFWSSFWWYAPAHTFVGLHLGSSTETSKGESLKGIYILLSYKNTSFLGLFFMSARIGESVWHTHAICSYANARIAGERLSPYVALACIAMAMTMVVQ